MKKAMLYPALIASIVLSLCGLLTCGTRDVFLPDCAPLETYEPDACAQYEELEIGDNLVYWRQRMLGGAIVEKDFIVYQFDKITKKLVSKIAQWRNDLPADIFTVITKEEAESMVSGTPLFSNLYIISPTSDVFPLNPTPKNPCWVVRTDVDGDQTTEIIDAVNGEHLGNGVSPPYASFSLTGPQDKKPCKGSWDRWYQSAQYWFDAMNYPCEAVQWPAQDKIQSHLQNRSTGLFYELAHGDSYSFYSGCTSKDKYESTTAKDMRRLISDYPEMRFAFIGSCEGMCKKGSGTFSNEFRKGSSSNTVTVGYCGMSEKHCSECWTYSVYWQDVLFDYMHKGKTVKQAFDLALANYPMCAGSNNCMRFAGDENFAGPYSR